MKKKLLIALSAVLVIVLAVGGYVLYEFKIKEYDTADPVVDELVEETFDLQLPDGKIAKIDKDGNIVEKSQTNDAPKAGATSTDKEKSDETEENDETKTNDVKQNGTSTVFNGNEKKTSSSSKDKDLELSDDVTVADIKKRYAPTFSMLEEQARGRLNSLISQAISEYSAKKNAGESISYGYFYNKYMGAATAVEGSTDAAMNTVVKMVENDLNAHGFEKSYAQSFKEQYSATKESLRSEMMNKVLSYR